MTGKRGRRMTYTYAAQIALEKAERKRSPGDPPADEMAKETSEKHENAFSNETNDESVSRSTSVEHEDKATGTSAAVNTTSTGSAALSPASVHEPTKMPYPNIYISRLDTVAVLLQRNMLVELTLGGGVRVCSLGDASAAVSLDGRLAAVHHRRVELLYDADRLFADLCGGARIRVDAHALRIAPHLPDVECAGHMWTLPANGERVEWMKAVTEHHVRLQRNNDCTTPVLLHEPSIMTWRWAGVRRDRCIATVSQARVFGNEAGKRQCVRICGALITQHQGTGRVSVRTKHSRLECSVGGHFLAVHTPHMDATIDSSNGTTTMSRRAEREQRVELCEGQLRAMHDHRPLGHFDAGGRLVWTPPAHYGVLDDDDPSQATSHTAEPQA